MDRARRLKIILWLVTGLAAAVAAARFLFGLGATTNLSDATPWGVWIGFDVMSGVALAAGGFVLTAIVYIFKLERYHAIVRPAVLTAFLGYLAVAVGLLFDLGLPWNIWHMIIYWNPHSPLFEVGWCVMLYLTVLSLEFFPVPAEEFSALAKLRRLLLKIRLPLVMAGIGLSTLHQSSLGSLFLIMPYHLHPLWYSPMLPINFFVSAVALGLLMVMFESHTTAYLYRRRPETEALKGLGKAARWVLAGYLVLRFGDLAARGELARVVTGDWRVGMFWFEIAIMAILPLVMFSIPAVRRSRNGQWVIAFLGVAGVVLNRVNVGGLMHSGRGTYWPSWTELTISAGVVSIAVLVFLFMIERFKVWEERPADPQADPHALPEFDQVGFTWLGVPVVAARTMYSLAFIAAAAVGFALLNPEPVASRGVDPAPAHHARGGETLWVDGNLDGYGVSFPHKKHQDDTTIADCSACHHMNLPRDRETGCHQCHSDMYLPTDAFRHDWHSSPTPAGAGLGCFECHPSGEVRSATTAKQCVECHSDLIPAGATIKVEHYTAIGYVQAMHQLCIGCHVGQKRNEKVSQCSHCHQETRDFIDAKQLPSREHKPGGKHLALPPY